MGTIMTDYGKIYQDAISFLNSGNLVDAERSFRSVLQAHPDHIGALNLLTVCLIGMERHREAEGFIERAVRINQSSDVSFYNYGLILKKIGRPRDALEKFGFAIRLKSDVSQTWNNRGTVYNDLKEYENAIADFDKAITLDQDYAEAYANRGKSLNLLKRYDEASVAYDKALTIKPDLGEAWIGRGNVCTELKRYDEALAAYTKALSIRPDLENAWIGRGDVFSHLKRYDEAFAAYDNALSIQPNLEYAWLGRGNVCTELKRYDEALAAYTKALSIRPDLEKAWLGRGNALTELRRYDEAFAAYDRAMTLKPDLAEAWAGRGNVFIERRQYDDAFVAYDRALALKPDFAVEGARFYCKMHLCDWTNFTLEREHLISSVKNSKANTNPFSLIALSASREDQLKCAKLWIGEKYQASAKPLWTGEIYNHNRIRVGYVSADFRQHATSHLMAGMFECHDKTQFEIAAISIGADDSSELRNRVKNAFDDFVEGGSLSDDEIAHRIKQKEIDILVDLNGFTQNTRTGIFALRAAPIQVNYLGYPGTMGANYIDYIIADGTLVPQSHQQDYSEKIAYLPDSYQVNDTKRAISEKVFSREEMGLPRDGFVFCCFNNSYKILPDLFDCWMRIIEKVQGSVFWLLETNETATRHLRMEAKTKGIDPERLVFAKKLPAPEHLARHRLADLFLDTLPYNAHTTASDALWAGLPVLTQIGEAFAGRVAASLLNAIGLKELITTTVHDYEALAIELATNPEKLATVRVKLANNRLSTPLFDTKSFTGQIETAYRAMYQRHQAGLPPDHIFVSK